MADLVSLSTPMDDLHVLQRIPFVDGRGSLDRVFDRSVLEDLGISESIAQVNYTTTTSRGTIRGLHYQHQPYGETKIVSCVRGSIFDVAVDLRQGSPTFLQWHAEVMTPDHLVTMVIPPGFAHGFQSLEDSSHVLYLVTSPYRPEAEAGIDPFEKRIGIEWPMAPTFLSERDRSYPEISADWVGLTG